MGRRPRASALDGCLAIDKPAGITSHDAVARVRGALRQPRAGHAGTLDPDATGVLVIGLGQATRLLRFASGSEKSYVGEIVLGATTTTLDAAGAVLERFAMDDVTLADARAAAAKLTGDILQVPPMVSALRVNGRRLHELARAGEEVERSPRPVRVARFDLEWADEPGVLRAEVTCSAGTYVRSLADDLGALLGGGAHLRNLRRSASGAFSLADAVPLESCAVADVRPAVDLVPAATRVVADGALTALVAHGRVLSPAALGLERAEGLVAVLDGGDTLLAVYEPAAGRMKPAIVLRDGRDGPQGRAE